LALALYQNLKHASSRRPSILILAIGLFKGGARRERCIGLFKGDHHYIGHEKFEENVFLFRRKMSHQSLIHAVQISDLKGALSRDPHNVKSWWSYIQLLRTDQETMEGWGGGDTLNSSTILQERGKRIAKRVPIYECALKHLPGSYKLWFAYLSELSSHALACLKENGDLSVFKTVNKTYERALQYMHKYPRIWKDYCSLLQQQHLVTRTRRTFDRALQALPVTQHRKIWIEYCTFVRGTEGIRLPPFIVTNVYHRYCQFDTSKREELVEYLLEAKHYNEAARQLTLLVDDSKVQKPKADLWAMLRDLAARHGETITSVNMESVLLTGIERFPEDAGETWCSIAEMHTRSGNFAAARDAYDQGIETVGMVRAFGFIFDRYTRFEEALTNAKVDVMERVLEGDRNSGEGGSNDGKEEERDVDLCLERLEALLARRALALNSVKLRQDENDVTAWNERINILKRHVGIVDHDEKTGDNDDSSGTRNKKMLNDEDVSVMIGKETIEEDPVAACYKNAVSTMSIPNKVTLGSLVDIWIGYAKHYISIGNIEYAEMVMKDASIVPFNRRSECAKARCAWAEMRLEREDFDGALALMKDAVRNVQRKKSSFNSSSNNSNNDTSLSSSPSSIVSNVIQPSDSVLKSIHQRLLYSPEVWNMYIDLEESIGTIDTTKLAYDRMIELKVASTQTILNYAELLVEHNYFEESFKTYEKGIELFANSKQNYEIWLAYLEQFVTRYGASKLERARELFEQCLSTLGKDTPNSKAVFLMYAKMEEEHGLVRRSIGVYERSVTFVPIEDMYDVFCIYLQKTEEYFGVVATRPIFEKALSTVPDADVTKISIRFAEMERQLGELDRARAIFVHGSQTCDPKRYPSFWNTWKQFELQHGNENTFKDMLQIKRTIGARFAAATYSVVEEEKLKAKEAAEAAVAAEEEALQKLEDAKRAQEVDASHKRKAEQEIQDMKAKRAKDQEAAAAAAEDDEDEIDLDD
jgi:pre-mRNA-splicing factor SYF1